MVKTAVDEHTIARDSAEVAWALPAGTRPDRARRRLAPVLRDPRLWIGAALLGALITIALLAGRLAPYDPHLLSGLPLERPSASHLLGTNDIGQDLLSQLLWGGRASLAVGASAAVGGVADLFLALSFLPLVILIVAHVGAGLPVVALTLGLTSWPAFARVLRARVATELAAGYVEAARALGARPITILLRHVCPATVPVATAKFVLTMQTAIVVEASLAFLGLRDPTAISWGGMIQRGVGYGLIFASDAWQWWLLPPILALGLLVGAVALIGWALDATVNPLAA